MSIGEEEFDLMVADNGIRMPADVDLENPPSSGMELLRLFVEHMQGRVELTRVYGRTARIVF